MTHKRLISLALTLIMIVTTFGTVTIVSAAPNDDTVQAAADTQTYNFKSAAAEGAVNVTATDVYSVEKGYGFVSESSALKSQTATPSRKVDTSRLVQDESGVKITETAESALALNGSTYNYNYGGLIFRVDTGAAGAYKLTVETTGSSSDTYVAVTGMQASRLTSTGTWDNAGLVPKSTYASWNGSEWSYTYVSGYDFIEIEIEPNSSKGGTVGIAGLTIEPLENNAVDGKPTIHILGDSTQKTYTFEENSMSSWGQTLYKMFDSDKVNVVNYSMGGRAMKNNYEEGRFNSLLYNVKEGDFVFIHSAHNDESNSATERFVRGADKTQYAEWLDMYCTAIEARGATPVLVSGMPRTSGGVASVSTSKPNGFDPDSPTFMKEKAASDEKVEYVDLFHLAKTEFERIGSEETLAIYQSLEAGETAGKTNSGSYANGHPDNKVDGTHYKEAAGKLFSKLIANDIYDQSASGSAKIKELAGYLTSDVQTAAESDDWSAVFPEWAKDVTNAKANGYSADNSYYRNAIEKMLQLGVLFKNSSGEFEPKSNIKTNDFIAALCAIWSLDTANFEKYYSSGDMNRETMAAIILDAYELKFGKAEDGSWNKPVYMTDYNGTTLSPDDPNYDPNLTGDSAQYYPLVGWGNLTDTDSVSREYLADFYEVYNLGLMRSEKGIERGKMINGTELEPKVTVTREKAAKELYFLFGLVQNKNTENQRITVPTNYAGTDENAVVYNAISYTAPEYEFSDVDIAKDGTLSIELTYNGTSAADNKLVVNVKNADGTAKETKIYDVSGSGAVSGLDVTLSVDESVDMYVVKSSSDTTKLSAERTAVCTNVVLPAKKYTASTVLGIQNGTLALTNLDADDAEVASASETSTLAASASEWAASKDVSAGETLMEGLTPVSDMVYVAGASTIDEKSYSGYIKTNPKQNGKFSNGTLTGSALKFTAPSDGVFWLAVYNLSNSKTFVIIEEGAASQNDTVVSSDGASGNVGFSVAVESGKTYYAAVLGSGSQFVAASFTPGAPSVSVDAYEGNTVRIDASPADGYSTSSVTATASDGSAVELTKVNDNQYTFVMPASDVEIDAVFNTGGGEPTPAPTSTPNVTAAPSDYPYTITKAEYGTDGKLSAELSYSGSEASSKAKLIVASYDKDDINVLLDEKDYDITGTAISGLDYTAPENSVTKVMVWDGLDTMIPLAKTVDAASAEPVVTIAPTTAPTATPVIATVLTVDASRETDAASNLYNTISEAVTAAKTINPQSEADRVTISVYPGNYEEQVKMNNLHYVTLQQAEGTSGTVNLYWHYCTGYCAGDCDLDGNYNPLLNWSDSRTWTGYNDAANGTNVEEDFTEYILGQCLNSGDVVNYYTSDGTAHSKTISGSGKHIGDFTDQAALYINSSSTDITIKDLNIVNSIPVMVTEGEKKVGVAPQQCRDSDHATSYVLPRRDNLTVCSEDTEAEASSAINAAFKISDDASKVKALEALTNLTAEQSAYLARSNKYNERGHAVSANGDRITFEGIRLRGNQDSLYISNGRMYFKDCNLIGGTDYIYGDAQAVFDNCLLGAEGMTNQSYGATVTAANHDAKNPYGYLFWNCTLYNMLSNIGTSQFGRPWRQASQITFYKTKLDDTASIGASAAGISSTGWSDMSGNEMRLARFYEYGTYNASGKTVDTSGRLVNASVEEGGTGMGSVLDKWQILEFNPRNYFNNSWQQDTKGRDEWDPMNFGDTYLTEVDAAIADAESKLTVPAGEETTVDLPTAPSGIEYKWESDSANAVITSDGKLEVVRPAYGEAAITTTISLYAMNTSTGYGDKQDVTVTIEPTTDTTNVYSIPVTINQSLEGSNNYTITLTKNDALIKSATISTTGTTATATLENIPVGTYDVKVVSESDDFTVTSPEDGTTTITGAMGETVALNITAQKIVDKTVDLGITYSSTEGFKSYDLIALAKAAAGDDEVADSDLITVSYKMNVTPSTSGNSFIDILATEPASSCKTSGVDSRFILGKLGHWNQLDMVDSAQGYSESSNGDDQWLNACGKFVEGTASTAYVTINYKTKTLSAAGEGSNSYSSYTFATFPSNYEKGKLYMGVYTGTETYEITSVKVTYKHLVTEEEAKATPVPVPEGEGIYNFENVTGGNQCSDNNTFTFVDGVDSTVASLFADATDSTKMDTAYTKNYMNYVSGTADNGTHPTVTLNAPAGKYRIYYVGYNHGNNVTATVNGNTYTAAAGENLAYSSGNASYILKYYAIDIEMTEANSTITFDSSDQWLPDTYTVAIGGTKTLGLAPEETAAPTATPKPTADPNLVYPDWQVGQLNADTTDGSMSEVEFDGKKTIDVTNRNAYTRLDSALSSGTVTFNTDVYYDPDVSSNGFRIYLENASGNNCQNGNTSAIIAEPINISNGVFCTGPTTGSTSGSVAASKGWYNVNLVMDYANVGTDNFITVSVKDASGTEVLTQSMNSISGVDTVLQQIRLISRHSGDQYFANMTITSEGGDVNITPAPTASATEAPSPTSTPVVTEAPTTAPTEIPTTAPDDSYTITKAEYGTDGKLEVELSYSGSDTSSKAKLIVASYDKDDSGVLLDEKDYDITGTTISGLDYTAPENSVTKIMVWDALDTMIPLAETVDVTETVTPTTAPTATTIDFTTMTSVPVYSETAGQGFVETSDAIMPDAYKRQVAPASEISVSSEGAKVTESTGSYLKAPYTESGMMDGQTWNYGGLIYRIDTGAAGAYHIDVEVTGSSSDTTVAPTGMQASRLTGTGNWDNCGLVAKTVYASWSGSTWSYDFATGEDFIEIEIEPTTLATADAPQTVGVKKITITPLANNEAGDKPTIHILGDSTQKSYSFNETISSWGQTLQNYFDLDKVNVINYSMGGRAMKSNYNEGRFGEILVTGKEGDYVFIHSAQNDETISNDRFGRGSSVDSVLEDNNANYQKWLDMYVEAIKARGMTPVLVTAMPRTSSGKYSESTNKPNGFNPDSPALMRAKAASDSGVALVELYAGAKSYIDSLDSNEIAYIYNTYEAGETPAENAANGTSGDGTHYREPLAKQWCRIMLQSIYDQSVDSDDTYADKDIAAELVALMPDSVQSAAASGDWSAVFPEMASDVSAVDIVPGATKQSSDNYYYRASIEKALQLGALHKDTDNNFKPTQTITVGEFARGIEKVFGLEENSLTNYTKTYAELSASANAASDETVGDTAEETETAALASETDDTARAAADTYTVTVQQSTGGTVTLSDLSAKVSQTANVPSGVTAGQVISDNDYFTLTAPAENCVAKNSSSTKFSTNSAIDGYCVEFRNTNPEKIVTYVAKATGIINVYCNAASNKPIQCVSDTTQEGSVSGDGIVEFDVEAGKTYKLWTRGGTGKLYGVEFQTVDYPTSTESLTVEAGHTVQISAKPTSGYLNKSISVDGTEVTTASTYNIEKIAANATVTATFRTEPEFVDTTMVATDAALTREVMAAILYDAYQAVPDKTIIQQYMAQTGSVPTPDDPNYDPNIQYEGGTYLPLTGWGALTDIDQVNSSLYGKMKAAYNLGLIRTETGITRGKMANGTLIEPTTEVTRAKAAKALTFCYIMTQPLKNESQIIPGNHNYAAELAAPIEAPNPDAKATVFTD